MSNETNLNDVVDITVTAVHSNTDRQTVSVSQVFGVSRHTHAQF